MANIEKKSLQAEVAQLRNEITDLNNTIYELQEVVGRLVVNTGDNHSGMTISESLAILAVKAAREMGMKGF